MKTLTIKSLMACVAIVLMAGFVSCEKSVEEPGDIPESKSAEQLDEGSAKLPPWGAHRTWLIGTPPDACYLGGRNCFDPIVIYGQHLVGLDNDINRGPGGVKDFFSDSSKWKSVFPDLGNSANKGFLLKLQSGNYSMDKISNASNLVYYVAKGGTPYEEFTFEVHVQ